MPMSIARLSAARPASSGSYIRKRLPQPKARIGTETPVRPSTRWGSFASAAAATGSAGNAATAPRARPLLPRKSRRESVSFFAMGPPLDLDAGLSQVLRHHLHIVRERHLGLFDLRVPLLLPLVAIEALVPVGGQDPDLLFHRHDAGAGEHVPVVVALRLGVLQMRVPHVAAQALVRVGRRLAARDERMMRIPEERERGRPDPLDDRLP